MRAPRVSACRCCARATNFRTPTFSWRSCLPLAAKARLARLAHTAFRNEAGDKPRWRHIEGGIGARRSGCGDFDGGETAIWQAAGHLKQLVGRAFLDGNVAARVELPVDGGGGQGYIKGHV